MKPQELRNNQSKAAPRSGRSNEGPSAGHTQVLVADCDQNNRDLLCAFLQRNGYKPIPVSSGLLALDALARHAPDLMLLDVTMQGLNGIDVLRQVRERYTPGELPVIMVSGHSESAKIVEALRLGANDYLCKPIEFSVARARIQSQMHGKRSETKPSATKTQTTKIQPKTEDHAMDVESAGGGLWSWNLETGTIDYGDAWKAILGYGPGDLTDSPEEWLRRIHAEDLPSLRSEIDSAVTDDRLTRPGGREGHVRAGGDEGHRANSPGLSLDLEHRLKHRDGTYRWVRVRGSLVSTGTGRRLAGTLTDITERKTVDPQTGLPSEIVFAEMIAAHLERLRQESGGGFGIVVLGIDRFRALRDGLGEESTLNLLRHFKERILEAVSHVPRGEPGAGSGPMESIARLSEDELGFLLATADPASAASIIETLHQSLNGPVTLMGSPIFVSTSAGVVISCDVSESPGQLLQDARTALAEARLQRSGNLLNFTPATRHLARTRLGLEHELYEAVAREQFELHYQPKVDLHSGRIVGFEALLRWKHPQRGLVAPLDFIPIAEQTGLILPLGTWVLRNACRQTREWQIRYPAFSSLTVSVNVSSTQLADGGLVKTVTDVLAETGLDPGCLNLDIPESVLATNAPVVAGLLSQLRRNKVGLHIDDFGTGYSSMQYLRHLPFDTLKIDRTFVDRLGAKREDTDITRAIVTLAHQLKLAVISEGIETREQMTMLKSFGVQSGQGYLFSKPLPVPEVEALLATRRNFNTKDFLVIDREMRGGRV